MDCNNCKKLETEVLRKDTALRQCMTGFEYTRQYVGYKMLPAIKGWSWFDADQMARKALALPNGGNNMAFRKELEILINRHSIENESNTPDWILANYIRSCLESFNSAIQQREAWYGRDFRPTPTTSSSSGTEPKP